jgi:hypothetical protein
MGIPMRFFTNCNDVTLIFYALIVLKLVGCAHIDMTHTTPLKANIVEGVGIENITVGQSSKSNVIEMFGESYRLTEHSTHSFQMNYEKLGLSFYYRSEDPEQTIFQISIRPPFVGTTTQGIVLDKSKMIDVIASYGPPTWRTTHVSKTWWSEYPGIKFHVEMEPSLPRFPLNEDVHVIRTIVMIDIVK